LSSDADADSKNQRAATASKARKELERQLGPEASVVRGNLEPTLHEALALKR